MKLVGRFLVGLVVGSLMAVGSAAAGDWGILSTEALGADEFLLQHPDWDGRGVLIAICDTGVDLDVDGLGETRDGAPKVVDVAVFSDQGRHDLEPARTALDDLGRIWFLPGEARLRGLDRHEFPPAEAGAVKIAYVRDSEFRGGDLGDLDRDDHDDFWAIVLYTDADGREVLLFDSDRNGDLADEARLDPADWRSCRVRLGGPDLHREVATAAALVVDEARETVALFVDDDGHGSHVAGIAAGYRIDRQQGYDGIAPGARLLAAKIGDGSLSGGATTPGSMIRAWRWAVDRARELELPLVIQMSYGVGSESEGGSDAERLIDHLLKENPEVVAVVSAGNEGPGISTVGLPAGATEVLSVGAMLARETAREIDGVSLERHEMFAFSSRGGELPKPDLVCPGSAASSVPLHLEGRNVMAGTSMAAPQASGAAALLLSAARATGLPIRRHWVMEALVRSSRPLAGYGVIDVGAGLPHLPTAWEIYQELAARPVWEPVRFRATTVSAEVPGGVSSAVFWRGPGWPTGGEFQQLEVEALFPPEASPDFRSRYFQAFDLSVRAEWLELTQRTLTLKGEAPGRLRIRFRDDRLRAPGFYQGVIEGRSRGRAESGVSLRIPVSVVVPWQPPSDGSETTVRLRDLPAARLWRGFVRVAPGSGLLEVSARRPRASKAEMDVMLFDPEGREVEAGSVGSFGEEWTATLAGDELEPGSWEVVAVVDRRSPAEGDLDLGFRVLPSLVWGRRSPSLDVPAGQPPRLKLDLVSPLDTPLEGRLQGRLTALEEVVWLEAEGPKVEHDVVIATDVETVELEISLPAEDFGLFTDIALRVVDGEGRVLQQDGLSYRQGRFTFVPPDGRTEHETFTLRLIAATADPDLSAPSWRPRIVVRRLLASERQIGVVAAEEDGERVVLWPDRPRSLALELETRPPALAAGENWVFELALEESSLGGLDIPISIRLPAH